MKREKREKKSTESKMSVASPKLTMRADDSGASHIPGRLKLKGGITLRGKTSGNERGGAGKKRKREEKKSRKKHKKNKSKKKNKKVSFSGTSTGGAQGLSSNRNGQEGRKNTGIARIALTKAQIEFERRRLAKVCVSISSDFHAFHSAV